MAKRFDPSSSPSGGEQNTLSPEEQSYVEESQRQRMQLEKQGQQNAFSGANMPGGEPDAGRRSSGTLHRVPERVPFTTIGKAFQDIERQPVQIIRAADQIVCGRCGSRTRLEKSELRGTALYLCQERGGGRS